MTYCNPAVPLSQRLVGTPPKICKRGGTDGTTNSVRLCGGNALLIMPLTTETSASRAITLAEFNCQTCAEVFAGKLATLMLAGVTLVRSLLMTRIVSAPSFVRTAENAARLSGVGTVMLTLMSPKVDLLPS